MQHGRAGGWTRQTVQCICCPCDLNWDLCVKGTEINLPLEERISPACLPHRAPGSAMLHRSFGGPAIEDKLHQRLFTFWSLALPTLSRTRTRTIRAKRRTLPQSFDLLQHSFGDLADLAWGQEREMKQLEQQ
jgi:hypothetical protein